MRTNRLHTPGDIKEKAKGFTLVEMVVAMGIFAIVAAGVAQAFAGGFRAFSDARKIQRNLETAQHAINTLAKELRTSTVVYPTMSGPATSVRFFDYSSSRCFEYRISGGKLDARWSVVAELTDLSTDCPALSGTWTTLTTGYVTGSFYVVPSDDGSSGGIKRIGRVTIALVVKNDSASTHETRVQTSVSLRDYSYVGL